MQSVLQRNKRMCLLFQAALSTFLAMPFLVVYYGTIHINQVGVGEIQSAGAIAGAVFGIPMGHFSDRLGTRRAMIVGATLITVTSATFWFVCDDVWEFQLNTAVGALGWCAFKTAPSTHMTATAGVGATYDKYESDAVLANGGGMLVGVVLGSVLVAWNGVGPALAVQPLFYAVAIWAAWRLVEPTGTTVVMHRYDSVSLRTMWVTVVEMLWRSAAVRWMVAVTAVLQAVTVNAFWLFQTKLQHDDIPLWLFGLPYCVRAGGMMLFAHFGKGHMQRAGILGGLGRIVAAVSLSLVAAVAVGGWPGIVMMFVGYAFAMAFLGQAERVALSKLLPGNTDKRNCELAVSGVVQALAFAVVSWAVGLLTEAYSVDAALLLLAGVCLVGGGTSLALLRRADA